MTKIVCRFLFYVVLVFTIIEEGIGRAKQAHRRGKGPIKKPYVASTNARNEVGRVQVERHTPFRGATSDVAQCAVRCNFDFQCMPRAPVLADVISAEKPEEAKDDDELSRLVQARRY